MTTQDFAKDSFERSSSQTLALDDACRPHQVEQDVRRFLLSRVDLRFSSLVVRRIHDGICLEGVVEVDGDVADIGKLFANAVGLDRVLNRLVARRPPKKG